MLPSRMTTGKIKLEMCWKWKCPACGRVIYHSGCEVRDADVRAEASAVFSAEDPNFDGLMIAAPIQVGCVECETVYDVDFGEDDEHPDSPQASP